MGDVGHGGDGRLIFALHTRKKFGKIGATSSIRE